jgi:predicted XRE-type DNA-binding protein
VLDDPVPALKRQLVAAILRIADQTHWIVAAGGFGLDEARMCDLRKGRIDQFSLQRLIRMLARVDRRVEVTITTVGTEKVNWHAVRRPRRMRFPPRVPAALRGRVWATPGVPERGEGGRNRP